MVLTPSGTWEREAPMAVSTEHIALQISGCGMEDSLAIKGSRIWGPNAEIMKFNDGEYRGYSRRGPFRMQAIGGKLLGYLGSSIPIHSGPIHLNIEETDVGYTVRGLYGGRLVYIAVVEPPPSAPLDEVWSAVFRTGLAKKRGCSNGDLSFPARFTHLPLDDRAAIMALLTL